MSHRPVGAAQSASPEQVVADAQRPIPPTTPTQSCPAGHWLRPGPHPGTQNPFGPLHTTPDVAEPQAASPAAPSHPHRPVAARHCGSAPPHSPAAVDEHSAHAPVSGPVFWQAGRNGSEQLGAPSAAQATQVCVVGEQSGVVPPQSAFERHATQTPPPPVESQSGVAAPHRLVSVGEQTAHAPAERQTGNCGSQSALEKQARHRWAPVSQTGRVPPQSELAAHWTHVLVPGSQTLPAAGQAPALPGPQARQSPAASHTGVPAPHSASAAQGRQAWVAPSQTGVATAQSAAARQATQAPAVASQSGRAPAHAEVVVAEHAPHVPLG
jgi:hypothetical protein